MTLYKDMTKGLLARLSAYEIHHVLRAENREADILSKLELRGVPDHIAMMCRVEEVERPNMEMLTACLVTTNQLALPSWIDEMREYIETGTLLQDQESAAKLKRRAPSYDCRLYKRSFGGPLLRCLLLDQAREVMDEVHNGICSVH